MTTSLTLRPREDLSRASRGGNGSDPERVTPGGRAARPAAILAAIGFASLAVFQAALAAGAPWGHAAWGGANADLSGAQQSGSAVSALFYAAAALIVLTRGRIIWRARRSSGLFRWGTWLLAAAMAVGAVLNFLSQSSWENVVLGPIATGLALLCTVVARSAAPEAPDHGRTA